MESEQAPCAQPESVCWRCGKKYGNHMPEPYIVLTWDKDRCDVCGREANVTGSASFRGMKPEWALHEAQNK